MFHRWLISFFCLAELWRLEIVSANSVVLKSPGDRLTLTLEEDIVWSERWKFCMSVKDVTTPMSDPAEMLLLMGSREGEVIEKLGLSLTTTLNSTTTVEVVQTRRNVTDGIIDIWISEEKVSTSEIDFECCLVHDEHAPSAWIVTVASSDALGGLTLQVNKSITFDPNINTTEITVEKLDNHTSHHIDDISVQKDCVTPHIPPLCTTRCSSLQYSNNVSLTGTSTTFYSSSICTGAGLMFNRARDTFTHVATISSGISPAVISVDSPVTICGSFTYENIGINDVLVHVKSLTMETLLTITLSASRVSLYPILSTLSYDGKLDNDWHMFCICWNEDRMDVKLDGVEFETEQMDGNREGLFSDVSVLMVEVIMTASTPELFKLQLSDINVLVNDEFIYKHMLCDGYVDGPSHLHNMVLSWQHREIQPQTDIEVSTRPAFHRPLISSDGVTPLLVCGNVTNPFSSSTDYLYNIDMCYRHTDECDVLLDQETTALSIPFSQSTTGVDCHFYQSYSIIGNPETTTAEMVYNGQAHVIPSTSYHLPENVTSVTYNVAEDGSACLDVNINSHWSLITFNAHTNVCMVVYDYEVDSELFGEDYYSSFYLPLIDAGGVDMTAFHDDTQYAFEMNYEICVNVSNAAIIRDVTISECGWQCLITADCIAFQATAYHTTDCALLPQSFTCADGMSTSSYLSSQPYLRQYTKKDCVEGYVLIGGQCIAPSTTAPAAEETVFVESIAALEVSTMLLHDASSIDVTVVLLSRDMTEIEPMYPGYYTIAPDNDTAAQLFYFHASPTSPVLYAPATLLHPFVTFFTHDGYFHVPYYIHQTADGEELKYKASSQHQFNFPLSAEGFHKILFDSVNLMSLADFSAFKPQNFVNHVHVQVWLRYRRHGFISESQEGTVLKIGEVFNLNLHMSEDSNGLHYSVDVYGSASVNSLSTPTAGLAQDVWYLIDTWANSAYTSLRVLDTSNMAVADVNMSSGIHQDYHERSNSHIQLKFSGQISCLYVYYEPSPLTADGHINFCSDGQYMFEEPSTSPSSSNMTTTVHTLTVNRHSNIMERSVADSIYQQALTPSAESTVCMDRTHVTASYVTNLTTYPLSHLQLLNHSTYSFDSLVAADVQPDRLACQVNGGVLPDGEVNCWTVEESSSPSYAGLCVGCVHLLIVRRHSASMTDPVRISPESSNTTTRRQDCLSHCTCDHKHVFHIEQTASIARLDEFSAADCSCILEMAGGEDIAIENMTCAELCPHWQRTTASNCDGCIRSCDCLNGTFNEYRQCVPPSEEQILPQGVVRDSLCTVDSWSTVNGRNCTDYCPALSTSLRTCVCNTLTQENAVTCEHPATALSTAPFPTELKNEVCDSYGNSSIIYPSDNDCHLLCPTSEERLCCDGGQTLTQPVCSHDNEFVNGTQLLFECISESNCNTSCLDIHYKVNCDNNTVEYNVTGSWKLVSNTSTLNPSPQTVCNSSCEDYPNWSRPQCAFTSTSTNTSTSTSTNTTTSTSTSTSTTSAPPTNTSKSTSLATPTAATSTTSTDTTADNTSTLKNVQTPPSSTFTNSTVTTTTTNVTSTTPTTSSATNSSSSTASVPTVTTTLPPSYESCDCADGSVYSVTENSRVQQENQNCLAACPQWSKWTEYCFCAVDSVIQYARTCEEGNNNGYILEQARCEPEQTQVDVTSESCVCPRKQPVDECDCNYKYGRTGYDCIFNHSNPIQGVCSKKDVYPYECADKCSSYLEYSEWTACAPCDIGGLEGTRSRSRDCKLPLVNTNMTDFKGTQVCNQTEHVTETCDCGYNWSDWGLCDCHTGKRERNRCWGRYPLSTTTVQTTSTTKPSTTTLDQTSTTTSMPVHTGIPKLSPSSMAATNASVPNTTAGAVTNTTTSSQEPIITVTNTSTSTTPNSVVVTSATTSTSTALPTTILRTTGSSTSSTSTFVTTSSTNMATGAPSTSTIQPKAGGAEAMYDSDMGSSVSAIETTPNSLPVETTTKAIPTTTHISQQSWCVDQGECGLYCPSYSLTWGNWEPCNCLKQRRYRDCISPHGASVVAFFTNTVECTEPEADYKVCQTPGCYSDWTTWSQCSCSMSRSNRTRVCLETSCSGALVSYEPCKLENMQCWLPWSQWTVCRRADGDCGSGGSKNRTRVADCSSAMHLEGTCALRTETETVEGCTAYTCTKDGLWGQWGEWADVKRCGHSNQTRKRDCEYSYRSIESWSNSTCDTDCWQCITDESDMRCFERECLKSCKIKGEPAPGEFSLTINCRGSADGKDVIIANVEKDKRPVQCGNGSVWSEWTACGISCGFQWGRQYRSQKCQLSEDESISALCQNVLFLQVQPQWCFVKEKCPDVRVVPTLIPEEQKAKNLPAEENPNGVYVISSLGFVVVGVVLLVVVLDLPSLFLQIQVRLFANLKSACAGGDGDS